MLSLLKKIKINPLFWFVIGIGILTGYFKEVIMVFLIVFIHEMGHSVVAHFFKWRIRKIELLPFGGVAEVEEYGNRPLKQEFWVIISGPLQHIWLIALSYILLPFEFWTVHDHHMFLTHNLMILCFNLLPIWPLDGGKLMYLFISTKFPFQKGLDLTLKCSLLLLFVFAVTTLYLFPFHLNLWIVLIFLLFSHYFEWKQKSYAYMRFLMERYYKHDEPFVLTTPITVSADVTVQDVLKKFRRGVKHKVVIKDPSQTLRKTINEKMILTAFFESKQATKPIGLINPP